MDIFFQNNKKYLFLATDLLMKTLIIAALLTVWPKQVARTAKPTDRHRRGQSNLASQSAGKRPTPDTRVCRASSLHRNNAISSRDALKTDLRAECRTPRRFPSFPAGPWEAAKAPDEAAPQPSPCKPSLASDSRTCTCSRPP